MQDISKGFFIKSSFLWTPAVDNQQHGDFKAENIMKIVIFTHLKAKFNLNCV